MIAPAAVVTANATLGLAAVVAQFTLTAQSASRCLRVTPTAHPRPVSGEGRAINFFAIAAVLLLWRARTTRSDLLIRPIRRLQIAMPATRTRFYPLETVQSSLIGLTGFTASIAPLAVPALLVALILVTVAQDIESGARPAFAWSGIRTRPELMLSSALFGLALASCTWAVRPMASLTSLAQIALLVLGCWYVVAALNRHLRGMSRVRQTRYTRALPLAAIFVGLYFLLEWATDNGATLFFVRNMPWLFDGFENAIVYSQPGVAVGLHEIYFNRTAAAIVLMTAGLTAALCFWPNPWSKNGLGLVVMLFTVGICVTSGSSTALLMLICGGLAFLFAVWAPDRTIRTLQALLIIATMAAIPLSMLPKAFGLEKSKLIPFSYQERVVIWNDLAHKALETPLLGIGINSIKYWSGPSGKAIDRQTRRLYWHPHNGYLQVWLELGLIGALLFGGAGYFLLDRIGSLQRDMQPYGCALSGASLIAIGPGWGLWQPWLVASICFGWVALLLVRFEFDQIESTP